MRAYELYQLRGHTPGYEAEDWFRAEHEIVAFLIDQESRAASESVAAQVGPAPSVIAETPPEKKAKKGASAKSATLRAKAAGELAGAGGEGEKKKSGKRGSAKKSSEGSTKSKKIKPE
jgi:hypothetical protein